MRLALGHRTASHPPDAIGPASVFDLLYEIAPKPRHDALRFMAHGWASLTKNLRSDPHRPADLSISIEITGVLTPQKCCVQKVQ